MKRTMKQYLEDLFRGCTEGYITITTLPGAINRHFPVTEIEQAAAYCAQSGLNTYYGTALRKEKLDPHRRGSGGNISTVVCMYADIDIKGPAHKQEKLPESWEEATSFLNELSLPPTYLIDSGNGIHAVWLLDEPFHIGSEDDRKRISTISLGFGGYLIQEARNRYGWNLDNVQDIARMLRAPDTKNLKTNPPKLARIIEYNDIRYPLSVFEAHRIRTEEKEPIEVDNDIIGSAERMRGNCAFIDYCINQAGTLSEPWWHAMLTIVSLTEDGREKAHQWSSPYDGYDPEETEGKVRRACKEKKPCSCAYIRELGFDCPEGGCSNRGRTVGGPIAFAFLSRDEQAERLLEKELTIDEALEDKNLRLVKYAKEFNPARYILLKKKYQKLGVGVRDLENMLRIYEQQSAQQSAQEDFFGGIELEGIDTAGLTMPNGWDVRMTGITHLERNGCMMVPVQIASSPVIITRRFEDMDDVSENLELAYYRDHHWKYLVLPRGDVMDKTKIIRAADKGLPVYSSNASALVDYLAVFETANADMIRSCRLLNRLGWIGGMEEFYPFHMRDEVAFNETTAEASNLVRSIRQAGDEAVWTAMAQKLREMPYARAMLAASFASVLLEPLQQRIIYLHLWKDSRAGKTASQKAAVSVWGDPAGLMVSYNSTQVGFERTAAAMNHLPLALDELQSCMLKPEQFSRIIYMLGNGVGRVRGDRLGGTQELRHWRNVILSTGEHPIITGKALDGIATRVMDICGVPIEDEAYAAEVHRISEVNYGFAGERFIRWLLEHYSGEEGLERLRTEFAVLREDIRFFSDILDGKEAGYHLDQVAVIALADSLASRAVFGLGKDKADEEAKTLGDTLLSNIHSQEEPDSISRAWDYICDWTQSNKQHFEIKSKFFGNYQEALSPVYGRYDPQSSTVYFIPSCFYEALNAGGYSPEKCYRGFKERGYIDSIQQQIRVEGVKKKAIAAQIEISINEDFGQASDEEERFLA